MTDTRTPVLLLVFSLTVPIFQGCGEPSEPPTASRIEAVTAGNVVGQWQRKQLALAPPQADGDAMAYDSARGVVVLYKGAPALGVFEWDGSVWTKIMPSGVSPIRNGHSLTYHKKLGETLLFGGRDPSTNTWFNEVWAWNGARWKKLAKGPILKVLKGKSKGRALGQQQPSPRQDHAAAYDPVRHELLVHGGAQGFGASPVFASPDIWAFNGTRWLNRSKSSRSSLQGAGPTLRNHRMVWDMSGSRLVLFGGEGPEPPHGFVGLSLDLLTWKNGSWTQHSAPTATPCNNGETYSPIWIGLQRGHSMAYHQPLGLVIIFGGYGLAGGDGQCYSSISYLPTKQTTEHLLNDLWAWNGSDLFRVSTNAPTPLAQEGAPVAYDVLRNNLVFIGEGGSSSSSAVGHTWLLKLLTRACVPACSSNANCDDGNACTTDTCNSRNTCSASCSNQVLPGCDTI